MKTAAKLAVPFFAAGAAIEFLMIKARFCRLTSLRAHTIYLFPFEDEKLTEAEEQRRHQQLFRRALRKAKRELELEGTTQSKLNVNRNDLITLLQKMRVAVERHESQSTAEGTWIYYLLTCRLRRTSSQLLLSNLSQLRTKNNGVLDTIRGHLNTRIEPTALALS